MAAASHRPFAFGDVKYGPGVDRDLEYLERVLRDLLSDVEQCRALCRDLPERPNLLFKLGHAAGAVAWLMLEAGQKYGADFMTVSWGGIGPVRFERMPGVPYGVLLWLK